MARAALRSLTLPAPSRRVRRGGFTLIELLVVVLIVLLITAVAIPVVAPAVQGRRAREASRELSTYFALARDRAIATGRPAGIWIERVADQPDVAFLISQCEVPPPFTGDSTQSRVAVGIVPPPGANGSFPRNIVCMPVEFNASGPYIVPGAWDNLIRTGDLIKFNLQGHTYELHAVKQGNATLWTIGQWTDTDVNGQSLPTNNDGAPQPNEFVLHGNHTATAMMLPPLSTSSPPEYTFAFQITRQPRKSSARPLQLPGGMVIDLNYSGEIPFGADVPLPFFTRSGYSSGDPYVGAPQMSQNSATEIAIMFAPNGSLEHVYAVGGYDTSSNPPTPLSGGTCFQPTSQLYLLIGERARVPLYADTPKTSFSIEEDDLPNWLAPGSIWVTVNPTTGLVSTSENISLAEQLDANDNKIIEPAEYAVRGNIDIARGFAAQSSSQGGR